MEKLSCHVLFSHIFSPRYYISPPATASAALKGTLQPFVSDWLSGDSYKSSHSALISQSKVTTQDFDQTSIMNNTKRSLITKSKWQVPSVYIIEYGNLGRLILSGMRSATKEKAETNEGTVRERDNILSIIWHATNMSKDLMNKKHHTRYCIASLSFSCLGLYCLSLIISCFILSILNDIPDNNQNLVHYQGREIQYMGE